MRYFLSLFLCAVLCVGCVHRADHLVVLTTNDTHSQIEPKSNGQGGFARMMAAVAREREAESAVLLLHAGDFCQGTPYFNFFHGRVEIDAMNRMGYNAATLGNHEFDNGLDTLAMLIRRANFPFVCANYDVTGTPLEGLVKPYVVLQCGGRKIGIFGLGVNPASLIADKNFVSVHYKAPYPVAQEVASYLRHDEHCDAVICLSHMGTYAEHEGDCYDVELASSTRDIDLIVGGHTHKVYDSLYVANLDGKQIPVTQMGKSGMQMGKITLNFGAKE